MAKILKIEDIKKAVVDYVSDDRKTQAVLLDGEWGCGKTFFIKEHLIPALQNIGHSEIYKISLYGISTVDMIQEMLYAQWLEKFVKKRAGKIGRVVNNGIGIFGKSAIHALESKIGVRGIAKDLAKPLIGAIDKNTHNIIIFDDLERCRVDIIQLMGFLNNLSENNGFKLILVANEKEVNRIDNLSEKALKYLVALKHNENTDYFKNNANDAEKKHMSVSKLIAATTEIFGEESLYERTREKLIGLTIPYSVSISEAFEAVLKKYIRDEDLQERVLANQDRIIKILDENEHRNLRTLIAAFIVIQDILSTVDRELFKEQDMLNEELDTIILYSVYSAIRKSTGKSLFQWPNDTRYACINSRFVETDRTKVYGYAFVDEYWKTQCVDKDVIEKDLKDRITYRIEVEQSRRQSVEHMNLALYKLGEWYMLTDEEVKLLVQQMKTELSQKKYEPNDFKEIVLTLMQINNPNFGMSYGKDMTDTGNTVYDSTEAVKFNGMEYKEAPAVDHEYIDWNKVNISEFVELMVSYFVDGNCVLTSEMIRVLSEDKQFAYNYRYLTMPLLEIAEKRELNEALKDNNGTLISDIPWDDKLEIIFKDKHIEYMNQGKFLSLFDIDKLKEHISVASAEEIYNFCDAVRGVYSFSNLCDVYSADLETINGVMDYIEHNYGKNINSEKSRTKEIAFNRLKAELRKYRKALGYSEEEI